MVTQEIINLQEAYASIYTSEEEHQESQELTEEVLIASQYFCEMGLNEDGIEILIEELGLDQFVDFVYHIAEEYYLTEARARGEKIEPKLSSGKPIQGKPKAASLKSLRKKKVARKEAEEKASEAKPSGLKASLKRQSAIAAASKKQPKKPGLLDRVAGAVTAGIERHNQANKNLNKNLSKASKVASEVGGLIGNVGRRVGGVAKEFGSGVSGTAKLAGHVAKKGLKEEVEEWVNALVEEGYDLSEYTWDDITEIYLNEGRTTSLRALAGESEQRKRDKERGRPETEAERHGRLMLGDFAPSATREQKARGGRQRLKDRGKVPKKDGKDMFEHVLEYLVSEGYADTTDNALVIMANMSEDWKNSIINEGLLGDIGRKIFKTAADVFVPKAELKQIQQQSRSYNPRANSTAAKPRPNSGTVRDPGRPIDPSVLKNPRGSTNY